MFGGIVVFLFVLQYRAFADSWQHPSIASILPVLFILFIVIGALTTGVRIGIKRIQDSWLSYELVIGEDFLVRRMKGHQEIEIQRIEIVAIKESEIGLRVQSNQKGREIGIPLALVGYEDAKARLSRWMAPVSEPHGWLTPSYWVAAFSLLVLALCGVFFLATRSWIVVVTGVPTVAVLLWSIFAIQKSVQASANMKRLSLLTMLTLLAIVARLILAIVHWR